VNGSVLLVDDDASLGETLAIGLRKRGWIADPRTSAADALADLETQDVDVLVTDLNMRGLGGTELCRRVVASRPDVPVIVLTAFGNLERAIEAIRAGAYDFINKPDTTSTIPIRLCVDSTSSCPTCVCRASVASTCLRASFPRVGASRSS
jgi:two-component system response regulator HydG